MTDQIAERVIRTDLEMSVAARDKGIHLLFSEKDGAGESKPAYTSNFLLSASDALTFSALLADLAFEVESGLKIPDAQKKELVERHREKLKNRITVILNSKREQKTVSNKSLAQLFVDVMSAEIFS